MKHILLYILYIDHPAYLGLLRREREVMMYIRQKKKRGGGRPKSLNHPSIHRVAHGGSLFLSITSREGGKVRECRDGGDAQML